MTVAEGTPQQVDGLRVGAESRRAAERAGVPVAYWIATRELGWFWAAALPTATPHLVPPYGDRARCGRALTRADRHPITSGIAASACDQCWRAVLGNTPRRSR